MPLTAEIKADILDTIGKFADKLYRNIALSYKDLANADPLDMDAPVDLKDPATQRSRRPAARRRAWGHGVRLRHAEGGAGGRRAGLRRAR